MMIIQYNFKYIHNNGLFIRLLNKISKQTKLEIFLEQNEDNYLLEAGGSYEKLEEFAHNISSTIANSLFLKSSSVKEIENFTATKKTLEDNTKSYAVPFCIECQEKIITNPKDLHLDCSVCGFSDVVVKAQNFSDFKKFGECKIQTFNGERVFSKTNGATILCNDYENISEYFIITQTELDALMSIEKPSIRLKPKLKFKLEYNLQDKFYDLFLPDDKITLAFCSTFKDEKIFFCDDENLPKIGAVLDRKLIIKSARDFQKNSAKDEIEMLRLVIAEHKLNMPSIVAFHLSFLTNSTIFSFDKTNGYKKIVEFELLPKTVKDVFELIENEDESGKKLISNFALKHKEHFDKILYSKINTTKGSIGQIFSLISLILQIEDLETMAIEFSGKSGPRIDYKVKDGKFDFTKTVRSIISFKLAGVDNFLISFGVLDSFADFLASQAQNADSSTSVDAIILSGNLFENRQLLLRALNSLEPNFKVYMNERREIWS